MFYGGRLHSHLTISEDEASAQFIRLLKINPKCAVIIDSDRKKKQGHINATKKRVKKEAELGSLMAWVTQGREMENYVAPAFWASRFNVDATKVSEYSKVFDHLTDEEKKIGNRKIATKMELATFAEAEITTGDTCLDIERKTKELIKEIRAANS